MGLIYRQSLRYMRFCTLAMMRCLYITGFAPEIQIQTSTYGEDWLSTLRRGDHTDCVLNLASGQEVKVHKIILSSASKVLSQVINNRKVSNIVQYFKLLGNNRHMRHID